MNEQVSGFIRMIKSTCCKVFKNILNQFKTKRKELFKSFIFWTMVLITYNAWLYSTNSEIDSTFRSKNLLTKNLNESAIEVSDVPKVWAEFTVFLFYLFFNIFLSHIFPCCLIYPSFFRAMLSFNVVVVSSLFLLLPLILY